MVRLKGLGTLLRAMAWIARDFPNSRLKLVGDGPEIRHLRKIAAELKLTANLQQISGVPFEKMPEFYNDSKVCVVASKTEGMPRTLMESLACGVPVVASALPQLAQFEGHGVILVEPNSERELAEAVISILTHEKVYESLCRKARELAEQHIMIAYRREYAGGWRHPFIDAAIATDLDRLMADRFIIGGPEQCVAQIRRFTEEYGMTHLICRTFFPGMPHAHIMRELELIAREVAPAFK